MIVTIPRRADPSPGASGSPDRTALVREIVDSTAAVASHQRCAIARRIHRQGISMAHLQILWLLQEHGTLRVTRLADLIGIAVPNATGMVDRMEQRGLVARDREAGDRRAVLVRATGRGLETIAQIDGWRTDLVEQLFADLDLAVLARIADGLRAVRASLGPAAVGPGRPGDPT